MAYMNECAVHIWNRERLHACLCMFVDATKSHLMKLFKQGIYFMCWPVSCHRVKINMPVVFEMKPQDNFDCSFIQTFTAVGRHSCGYF